jgi:hypothetical protein
MSVTLHPASCDSSATSGRDWSRICFTGCREMADSAEDTSAKDAERE